MVRYRKKPLEHLAPPRPTKRSPPSPPPTTERFGVLVCGCLISAFSSRIGCLLKAVTVSSSSCIPVRSLGTWLIFATSSSARLSTMTLLWSKNNSLLSSHCDWCLCTIGVKLCMTPWHNGGAILSIVFLIWATYNPMGMHRRRDVRFPQECVYVPVMCVYCVGHLLCSSCSRG